MRRASSCVDINTRPSLKAIPTNADGLIPEDAEGNWRAGTQSLNVDAPTVLPLTVIGARTRWLRIAGVRRAGLWTGCIMAIGRVC